MDIYRHIRKNVDGSIYILLLSVVLFSWTHLSGDQSESEEDFYMTSQWTVSQGESLWKIASFASEELDLTIDQTVLWIKAKNNLDNESIYPGQQLEIPSEMKGVALE